MKNEVEVTISWKPDIS